jgi:hypothetical protein
VRPRFGRFLDDFPFDGLLFGKVNGERDNALVGDTVEMLVPKRQLGCPRTASSLSVATPVIVTRALGGSVEESK